MEDIEVGDRIQYKRKIAEVKWKGFLPEMESLGMYLGVEVITGRGKNNGDFNGIQVFQVDTPGQGDFLAAKTRIKKLTPAAESGWEFQEGHVVSRANLRQLLKGISSTDFPSSVINVITEMAFMFQFDPKTIGRRYEDVEIVLSDKGCLASFQHASNRFTKCYGPQMILTSIALEPYDKITFEIIETSVHFYTSLVVAPLLSEPAHKLGNVKLNGCCLYNGTGTLKFPDHKIKCEEFTSGDVLSISLSENKQVTFHLNETFQGSGSISCNPPFRVGVMCGGFCKVKLVKMEQQDKPVTPVRNASEVSLSSERVSFL